MIEIIGWIGTVLVLIGYLANSHLKHEIAMYTWIVGDICWITYDVFIDNWSHLILSIAIVAMNIRGIYRIIRGKAEDGKG